MKPLDATATREDAVSAFNILRSFRSSESVLALIDYMDARMAHIQASAVMAGEVDRARMKIEFEMLSGLRLALDADPESPVMII